MDLNLKNYINYFVNGLIMNYPLRNIVFEKIKQYGNITDHDLINSLSKDDIITLEDDLNKILLDLEIYGLIRVNWITKDKKRIEIVNQNKE
jgi:hypothetical protein